MHSEDDATSRWPRVWTPRKPSSDLATVARYRMFVDEVGDSGLGRACHEPNHRYLGLTGVIVGLNQADLQLEPRLAALKRKHLVGPEAERIVLHRKDIVNSRGPFGSLRDAKARAAWDEDVLELMRRVDFRVVSTVLDKAALRKRYRWPLDPYHYGMEILMERFHVFLRDNGRVGDTMVEARSPQQDRRLKATYRALAEGGTRYVQPAEFAKVLTSSALKVKPKSAHIGGLQLADLVAHPAFRALLVDYGAPVPLAPFAARVHALLTAAERYVRLPGDSQYGRKWLP